MGSNVGVPVGVTVGVEVKVGVGVGGIEPNTAVNEALPVIALLVIGLSVVLGK